MYRKILAVVAAVAVAAVAIGFGAKTTEAAPVVFPGGPYFGTVGVPVVFNAGNTIGASTFVWDFGDGTTGTGIVTSHIYSFAGTFTVRLTATDSFGQSSIGVTTAHITNPAPPVGHIVQIVPVTACSFGTVFINGVFVCNTGFVTVPVVCPFFTVVPGCVLPVVPVRTGNIQTVIKHGR